jgi:DNA repair protein RadD
MVRPPPKAKGGNGEAPIKVCDNCKEICHAAVLVCPACGHPFPPKQEPYLKYRDVDIMGEKHELHADIKSWVWRPHTSRSSGKEMIKVTYYPTRISTKPITEYFPVMHDGIAGSKALRKVMEIAQNAQATVDGASSLQSICDQLNLGYPPSSIFYTMDGTFHRVSERKW